MSQPRSLVAVNGFGAAPAIAEDGQAVVAVSDYGRERSRILAFTRSARGRWAARPLVLRTSRQELLEPRAAFTGDGTGVFAWMRAPRIDQEQVVETRRVPASGDLGEVESPAVAGGRAVSARVSGGPGDRALVGWENGDYALNVSQSGPGGFEPSQRIFDRHEFGFSLGHLPDGTTVALSQAFGAGGAQVRLRPPGAAWGEPVTLSGPRTAREAVLATGRDGTIAVAWAQHTESGYRVQVSVRPPGGAFSAARTVAADEGEARAPGLAVQRDGSVLLAWLSGARLGFFVRGGEIRLAGVTAAGQVSLPRRLPADGARRIGTAPQIFPDADGDALIAWEESRRLVAVARDASGRLSAPRAVSAAGARIFSSRIVANGRGQALAAWTVDRGSSDGGALIQAAEIAF